MLLAPIILRSIIYTGTWHPHSQYKCLEDVKSTAPTTPGSCDARLTGPRVRTTLDIRAADDTSNADVSRQTIPPMFDQLFIDFPECDECLHYSFT